MMAKKRRIRKILESDISAYDFEGSLEETIKELQSKVDTHAAQGFTDLKLDILYVTDYVHYASCSDCYAVFELSGYRNETDVESKRRLEANKKAREKAKTQKETKKKKEEEHERTLLQKLKEKYDG